MGQKMYLVCPFLSIFVHHLRPHISHISFSIFCPMNSSMEYCLFMWDVSDCHSICPTDKLSYFVKMVGHIIKFLNKCLHLCREWCEIGPQLLGATTRKSQVPDRTVLLSMTLSVFERGSSRDPILGGSPFYDRTVWPRVKKYSIVNYVEMGIFVHVRHAPNLRRGPQCSQIFRDPGPCCLTYRLQQPNFQWWQD